MIDCGSLTGMCSRCRGLLPRHRAGRIVIMADRRLAGAGEGAIYAVAKAGSITTLAV